MTQKFKNETSKILSLLLKVYGFNQETHFTQIMMLTPQTHNI